MDQQCLKAIEFVMRCQLVLGDWNGEGGNWDEKSSTRIGSCGCNCTNELVPKGRVDSLSSKKVGLEGDIDGR